MRKPVEVFFACVIALGAALPAAAQPNLITCILTSEVPLLRLESQAELIGEIQFVCTGGDPNTVRFVNFELYLATTISSDITGPDPDGTEALLLIDDPLPGVVNTSNGMTYNGQVKGTPGVAPGFGGGPGAQDSGNVYQGFRVPGFDNRLSWNGIPFVPAPLGSIRIIRFLNVRADMTQFTVPPNTPVTITAALSANPPNAVQLGGPWLDVGRVVPSMTVSVANNAPVASAPMRSRGPPTSPRADSRPRPPDWTSTPPAWPIPGRAWWPGLPTYPTGSSSPRPAA